MFQVSLKLDFIDFQLGVLPQCGLVELFAILPKTLLKEVYLELETKIFLVDLLEALIEMLEDGMQYTLL